MTVYLKDDMFVSSSEILVLSGLKSHAFDSEKVGRYILESTQLVILIKPLELMLFLDVENV